MTGRNWAATGLVLSFFQLANVSTATPICAATSRRRRQSSRRRQRGDRGSLGARLRRPGKLEHASVEAAGDLVPEQREGRNA